MSTYKDQRQRSVHFRDGKFHNPVASAKSLWSFLSMRMSTTYSQWPEWIDSQFGQLEAERNTTSEIHVTHINHATVLLQVGGLNILTDPIYSDRCSPVQWIGPKRVRSPGIQFEKLPPIDIVLISHDHYDHLDLGTIEKLYQRDKPRIYMGLGVGRSLPESVPAIELDWWQSVQEPSGAIINFVPVQHFSGRGLFDRNSTLWGGYVLQIHGLKIYFGGDTGYASHFTETKNKFGPIDFALLPIGAYEPRDFMKYAHMNPEEAVQAHLDLSAKVSLGVHYGTFQLTAEDVNAPIKALDESLAAKGIPRSRFITPEFGAVVKLDFSKL